MSISNLKEALLKNGHLVQNQLRQTFKYKKVSKYVQPRETREGMKVSSSSLGFTPVGIVRLGHLLRFHIHTTLLFIKKQINARVLIGQSAIGYCKPTENSRVF